MPISRDKFISEGVKPKVAVKDVFRYNPDEAYTFDEIVEKTGLSHTEVRDHVHALLDDNDVTVRVVDETKYYSVSRDDPV